MNKDVNSVNDNEEYSPYILSLTDEDGKEFTFEVLDDIDFEDERYMALLPQYDDPVKMLESSGELVILKIVTEDGEDAFIEIEDDDEYERVASIFTDRLQDLFEIE
ncbi:MAG: DUF1292 domain-containing protein [Acutalibacteraceae bacterium]|nr:DUF1292 domain-containing protein [Acutalibacteraceae bacterium]